LTIVSSGARDTRTADIDEHGESATLLPELGAAKTPQRLKRPTNIKMMISERKTGKTPQIHFERRLKVVFGS